MAEHLRAAYLHDRMIEWRHMFHAHPELGFDEHHTSDRVAELLASFGIEVHRGVGGTGVVGVLQRGNGTGSIGLRADMDALPIAEVGGLEYASTRPDVMHACGHDGHTAMLLGAACALSQEGRFDGRVVFIFQPSEENGRGAQAMIGDGLFGRLAIDQIFGIHNLPGLPIGTFAMRTGPITASESRFEIGIEGHGGHAALPHMGVDAITVGAEIVGALQTIVSRKLDPSENGVVSVTEFVTDGRPNVLPGRAVLRGDARALTPEANETIERQMRRIVEGICAAHSVTAQVSYDVLLPPTINAAAPTAAAAAAAVQVAGASQVNTVCLPKLFSEDFAHFALARPASFVLIGNGTEGRNGRPLHAADYDFCDDTLPYGASFWMNLVESILPLELG